MAYWGIALTLGPNINSPSPGKVQEREAWEAIVQARRLNKMVSQKEEDFIDALSVRYMADTTNLNRDSLNLLYRDAMQQLSEKYPEDTEILTLFGASVMNTMPWDYYDKNLQARPSIPAAVAAFERVFRLNSQHPGAHHYYIHIVEASNNPDRGVPSADALGDLIPASGHLVHMPSHIYARVGRYEDAANSNIRAIEADEDYISQCQAQGVYPLGYYPHNIHFLWMAASFQGKSAQALDAAEKVANKVPVGMANNMNYLQEFLAVPLQAYVRFGRWNDILTTPVPMEDFQQYRLFLHYARSIAFTRKGLYEQAQGEIDALQELSVEMNEAAAEPSQEPEEPMSASDSMAARVPDNVFKIALNIATAERAAALNNYDEAITLLQEAVEAEDDLPYSEPPIWHQPVRHVLGAVLSEAGQWEAAIPVYEQDLKNNRDNGWALFGLYQCLEKVGKKQAAAKAKVAFERAWKDADVELTTSRF
jgi:tetratricopeptide (TPR) repeat protein